MKIRKSLILFIAFATCPFALAGNPCAELKVGESRVSSSLDGADATGLPHAQEIERTGKRSYRIRFPISFFPEPDSASFRERILACLEELNPKLRAKDDEGEEWKIELALADSGSALPPIAIRIIGNGFDPRARGKTWDYPRADSLTYPANISCQSVVHELLHLGGLVDEYSEKPKYPCRGTGPLSSIMANEYLALGETGRYALQPAHVRALVYPGCQEKNARYYRCARQAYVRDQCQPLPGCDSLSGWLR